MLLLPLIFALLITPSTILAYSIGGGAQFGGNGGRPTYDDIGGGVNVQPNNGAAGSYCSYDSQCSATLKCTPSVNGVRICLPSNSNPTTPSCTNSCPSGTTCTIRNGVGSCEVDVGGYVSPARSMSDLENRIDGQLNSPCERDADCDPNLNCILYFGELMCRHPLKPLLPIRCASASDCPSSQYLCVFSTALQDRVCYKYGETVTDGYVIPIKHRLVMESSTTPPSTATIIPESHAIFPRDNTDSPMAPEYMRMEDERVETQTRGSIVKEERIIDYEPIDPAATVCQFDYHCRMGESCSGRVRFVDQNVTTCRYDILNKHRQCLYHSDCLSGQRCHPSSTSNSTTIATCQPDLAATLRTATCTYDYECSGGEKCTKVADGEEFRCLPPVTQDPRHDQLCTTNAQCPFQQVCRRSAGFAMCVDVHLIHQ